MLSAALTTLLLKIPSLTRRYGLMTDKYLPAFRRNLLLPLSESSILGF